MAIVPQGQQPRLRLVRTPVTYDCPFCHGEGAFAQSHGDESYEVSCQACDGTGKDDFLLEGIMSGVLVPPVEG